MEYILYDEQPELHRPTLIATFAGWPDAGEVGSGSLRYLLRKLRAQKFAAIDPEEFYDFTEVRPHSVVSEPWQREIRWPSNDFHYARTRKGQDLILFLGREPSLRWRTYVDTVLGLAERFAVQRLITLGGTFDSVPHTGQPRISGTALDPTLREGLQALDIRPSSYQGPTSIHSALHDACRRRGIAAGSVWGHAPHYLQAAPNVKVCYGVLSKLTLLLDLNVDLEEIRGAARALEIRVERLLEDNAELREYVRQLEAGEEPSEPTDSELTEADLGEAGLSEMPSPEAVVRELEEFLRQQRQGDEGEPPPR